jgi:hypothetical protein
MSSIPLSHILLPAVFISSTVFSVLTLPFAFIKSEPVVIELPPFFSGEIQPLFDGENKDIAIPYVGFAIVVSVGAGIASVELQRRWHAYRESLLIADEPPSTDSQAAEAQTFSEVPNSPEFHPDASRLELTAKPEGIGSPSLAALNTLLDTQPLALTTATPVASNTALQSTAAVSSTTEDSHASAIGSEPQSQLPVHLDEPLVEASSLPKLERTPIEAFDNIVQSAQEHQTCRIRVPHREQRLLAILVDDQYYSFFRIEPDRETVRDILTKLGQRLEKAIITQTVKGYAIWTWEPEVSTHRST